MPWTIRLRWIMENADDLSSALALWAKSNNTVGFNHMIASRVDVPNTAAVCLETMAEYTAYFLDNDPREASATYNGERIGFPLKVRLLLFVLYILPLILHVLRKHCGELIMATTQ